MLSFRELQEKKSKIKINPKKEDVIEGAKTMKPEKGEDCHCDHTKNEKKKRKEDTDHTEGMKFQLNQLTKRKQPMSVKKKFQKKAIKASTKKKLLC